MAYKSVAQREKFHAMLKEGKISSKVVKEFDAKSKGKRLPERLTPKKPKDLNELKAIAKKKGY